MSLCAGAAIVLGLALSGPAAAASVDSDQVVAAPILPVAVTILHPALPYVPVVSDVALPAVEEALRGPSLPDLAGARAAPTKHALGDPPPAESSAEPERLAIAVHLAPMTVRDEVAVDEPPARAAATPTREIAEYPALEDAARAARVHAAAAPTPPGALAPATLAVAGGVAALVGGLALYYRLRARDILAHATRERVYDLVTRTPGLTLHELTGMTDAGYDTVTYHVDRLVREGLAIREGEKPMRLFPVDVPPQDRLGIVALRTDGAARVLAAVEAAPGLGKAALGRAVQLSPPSVTWHLERLSAGGLLVVKPAGIGFEIVPKPERIAMLRARISAAPAMPA